MIRPLNFANDRERLLMLDASFMTDRIYLIQRKDLSIDLIEAAVQPPIHKQFDLSDLDSEWTDFAFAVVAEDGETIQGFAAVRNQQWNNRPEIWHLYVAAACRGQGIGGDLMRACVDYARSINARCLWLETQNINYPAIQFYLKQGFEWCGLDTELYDPDQVLAGECALYFSRQLD